MSTLFWTHFLLLLQFMASHDQHNMWNWLNFWASFSVRKNWVNVRPKSYEIGGTIRWSAIDRVFCTAAFANFHPLHMKIVHIFWHCHAFILATQRRIITSIKWCSFLSNASFCLHFFRTIPMKSISHVYYSQRNLFVYKSLDRFYETLFIRHLFIHLEF